MRIATQNINWGGEPTAPGCDGGPRLKRLVPWLASLDADLLVLTEFKSGPLGKELKELLADAGYPHLLSHKQEPFKLGTAIASQRPVTVVELPIPPSTESWRSIGVGIDGISVFGFYFPLNEAKLTYWDWLLANAEKLRDQDVILLGDFNTGRLESTRPVRPLIVRISTRRWKRLASWTPGALPIQKGVTTLGTVPTAMVSGSITFGRRHRLRSVSSVPGTNMKHA